MKGDGRYPSGLRRLVLGVTLAAFGATGCALPWVDGEPGAAETGPGDRGLAAEAEFDDGRSGEGNTEPSLPNDSVPPASDTSSDGSSHRDEQAVVDPSADTSHSSSPGPDSAPGSGDPHPDDSQPAAPGPSAPTRLIRIGDHGGDAGRDVPEWADVLFVELVDDANGQLMIHVEVAGTIPGRLDDGEVAGIGIDLYTSGGSESDHQIFLDGSTDGWFAYLHTGGELVAYPGTFAVDGTRFTATVPWEAIGNARSGDVAVFADWSTSHVDGLLATSSQDRAPDEGRVSYG